jgi:hypothetical protein
MQYEATSPDDYIRQIPEERKPVFSELREVLRKNLPEGFTEELTYGMISYVVPHSTYPAGYHVNPKIPLPFISIASQKNFIAMYHSGLYVDSKLDEWFREEYAKRARTKLDMGKSCVRFKKPDDIPMDLIAELATKITVQDWIDTYEAQVARK